MKLSPELRLVNGHSATVHLNRRTDRSTPQKRSRPISPNHQANINQHKTGNVFLYSITMTFVKRAPIVSSLCCHHSASAGRPETAHPPKRQSAEPVCFRPPHSRNGTMSCLLSSLASGIVADTSPRDTSSASLSSQALHFLTVTSRTSVGRRRKL